MTSGRTCPVCGQGISRYAIKCGNCGRFLPDPVEPEDAGPSRENEMPARPSSVVAMWFDGKFHKARMAPIEGMGLYRGAGRIRVDAEGLWISGRHVLPRRTRVLLGALLWPFLTLIGAYVLMEFVFLTAETVTIPWPSVRRYAADAKTGKVAIEFSGPEWTSPIVIGGPAWAKLHHALRAGAPAADVGPGRQRSHRLLMIGGAFLALFVHVLILGFLS